MRGRGGKYMVSLGILDHSHIGEGRTARDALAETTALAQAAERLGYTRFWVSEHHSARAIAHSSPEVLLAHIGAHTSRIRIGSGGVMLPHYSAYKVTENFRLLEALYPGRIDLGLGRAPGGPMRAAWALQNGQPDFDRYPHQVSDLLGYLHGTLPADHLFARLTVCPEVPTAPDVWLLGSSDDSALLAAQMGLAFGFAQFFGIADSEAVVRMYREQFRPSPFNERPRALVAVMAICAETEDEADRLARSSDLHFLGLELGRDLGYLPSVETAENYPYTEFDRERIAFARRRRFIGTPGRLKEALLELCGRCGADELMIVTPVHDPAARLRSFELLAEAFGLGG